MAKLQCTAFSEIQHLNWSKKFDWGFLQYLQYYFYVVVQLKLTTPYYFKMYFNSLLWTPMLMPCFHSSMNHLEIRLNSLTHDRLDSNGCILMHLVHTFCIMNGFTLRDVQQHKIWFDTVRILPDMYLRNQTKICYKQHIVRPSIDHLSGSLLT